MVRVRVREIGLELGSELGLGSGLGLGIRVYCAMGNQFVYFFLICLSCPLSHTITIFFPATVKLENGLCRNQEFPNGKYVYFRMGLSSHRTENNYFSHSTFFLGNPHKMDIIMGLGGRLC